MNKKQERPKDKRKYRPQYKRSDLQFDSDQKMIIDLHLRGLTLREITDIINKRAIDENRGYQLTFQQIYKDIEQCRIEWKRSILSDIEKHVGEELAKVDLIEKNAWSAYETCKRPQRKTRFIIDDEGNEKIVHCEEIDSTKGSSFLDILVKCRNLKINLLGLNKNVGAPLDIIPDPIAPTNVYNFNNVPSELLVKLAENILDNEQQNR